MAILLAFFSLISQFGLPAQKTLTPSAAAKPVPSPVPPAGAFVHERFWHHLIEAWKTDFFYFVQASLPKLVVVVLITLGLLWILRFATRRLRELGKRDSGIRAAQIKTLSRVIEAAGIGLIIFHAIIQTLEIFNINVTPLLASAGVAGVAIGFGAQTIVHDVINGMLILVENQFNVGETVKIAGLTGIVEDMSLRKTTLRDGADGSMYVIPNSQITTVANLTRDWSQIQVNISVDYREDPDRIIALLKGIADGLAKDPKFSSVTQGDPAVVGIDAFKGSEVIYPVIFKTSVGGQWDLAREFRRRVKKAFDREHILLGDPQRVYNYPSDGGGARGTPTAQGAGGDAGTAQKPGNATLSPTDPTPQS